MEFQVRSAEPRVAAPQCGGPEAAGHLVVTIHHVCYWHTSIFYTVNRFKSFWYGWASPVAQVHTETHLVSPQLGMMLHHLDTNGTKQKHPDIYCIHPSVDVSTNLFRDVLTSLQMSSSTLTKCGRAPLVPDWSNYSLYPIQVSPQSYTEVSSLQDLFCHPRFLRGLPVDVRKSDSDVTLS